MSRFIIIGAGQAATSLATKLRDEKFAGEIIIIGDEDHIPYQRPPLSKKYLTGEMQLDQLNLKPENFYSDNNIELITGKKVHSVNRENKTIELDGEKLVYDKLAFATGSRPRTLPAKIGGDLKGVYVIRSIADVDRMEPEFIKGAKLLIIGGGYIGLEAAAVAAQKGLKVTLVEMADRILQRVACKETSDFFRQLHQEHGVEILENVGLERLEGANKVSKAILSNGTQLDIDFVIAGIGILPNIELAEKAGLEIENGIKVDEFGKTSDKDIFAAGDCCSFPYQGEHIRLESVPNAIDQAKSTADSMLDNFNTYIPNIWFWSDQYDITLQIAGLNTGYDRIITRDTRSDPRGGISFWYYQGEELLAVDAAKDPRSYMMAKRWIAASQSPKIEDVENLDLEVKNFQAS